MEALLSLRTCVTESQEVLLQDGFLVLGDKKFPAKTKTPYRSAKGNLYELDALWFYLYNYGTLGAGKYFTGAKKAGVDRVEVKDRKDITNYMTGKTNTSANVEESLDLDDTLALSKGAGDVDADGDSNMTGRKRKASELVDASQWGVEDIVANERAFCNRKDSMAVRASFLSVMDSYDNGQKQFERARKLAKNPKKAKKLLKNAAGPQVKVFKPRNATEVIPIIIVPSARSSILTLFNAEDFLARGGFVPSEAKRKTHNEQKLAKPTVVEITRVSSKDKSRNVKYHLVDNIKSIKQWERVVAVFATGANWQFNGYPWDTPAHVFSKVQGFHLHFSDEDPKKTVQNWNCKTMKISKSKRYGDRGVVLSFWRDLVDWISVQPDKKNLEF